MAGKKYARLSVLIAVLTVASVCPFTSTGSLGAEDAEVKELIVGLTEGVVSANPFIGFYDSDIMLYSYIYDSLTAYDEDGNVVPNLAKSWWYMDGNHAAATGSNGYDFLGRPANEWPMGSIWEYNLTENVNWSDGHPFDADDVVFTIQLQTGYNLQIFWAYRGYTEWIDHAQKVDQFKVRLYFTNHDEVGNPPIPIAWGNSIEMPILPKHMLQDKSPVEIAQNWTGIPAIGTGPFMHTDSLMDDIISKEGIILYKNPEWEKGLGRIYNRSCAIEKLTMKFFSEQAVLIQNLEHSSVDAARISHVSYLSLKNESEKPYDLKLVSKLSPFGEKSLSYFRLGNTSGANPARFDPAIHRACALATDQQSLVDDLFEGMAVPGNGLISPVYSKWYYDAYSDYENISWFNVTSDTGGLLYSYHGPVAEIMKFNITRANYILNISGYEWPTYPDGYRIVGDLAAKRLVSMGAALDITHAQMDPKTGNPRTIAFENQLDWYDGYQDMAKYLSSQWKAIGVRLDVRNSYTWLWYQYPYPREYSTVQWEVGDPDPNGELYSMSSFSLGTWNDFGITNASYDDAFLMQSGSLAPLERAMLVKKCQQMSYLWSTPIVTYPKSCYGYNDDKWTNWGDWETHPFLCFDYYFSENPLFFKLKWAPADSSDDAGMVLTGIATMIAVASFAVYFYRKKKKKEAENEGDESDVELDGVE